jgi:hypothetical protein
LLPIPKLSLIKEDFPFEEKGLQKILNPKPIKLQDRKRRRIWLLKKKKKNRDFCVFCKIFATTYRVEGNWKVAANNVKKVFGTISNRPIRVREDKSQQFHNPKHK